MTASSRRVTSGAGESQGQHAINDTCYILYNMKFNIGSLSSVSYRANSNSNFWKKVIYY